MEIKRKKRCLGRVQYWTLFNYGGNLTICSNHKTEAAAQNAADRCEAVGGAEHIILRVEFLKRREGTKRR